MKTIIFDINEDKKLFKKSALAVRKGAVAVFATDTVYGIGTNAFNKKSVLKIYKLKKRPVSKPLPLLVSSVTMAKKFVIWNKFAQKLAKKFLPGALTLVLNPKPKFGFNLQQGLALRIADHKKLLQWIKCAGVPIASTSANLSAKPAVTKASDAIKKFNGKVDYILTDGNLKGAESDVVDLRGKTPVILRQRKIKLSNIKKIV
ncbi:MAG TPA: L-threonylcarbamoyladenylate synthase [Elusimicrobiales bacterium]|nr:L-threonylcarbamoyladenylate synthase [Elusimicrobiales bacterium]